MNLQKILKFTKKFFNWSDLQLAEFLGVSRSQITKMNHGYVEGVCADTLKRVSQLLRVSVDELLDNEFFPPSYHISKQIYSVYMRADRDYPEFSIAKNDTLYIRPFVHEESKYGQLVLTYTDSGNHCIEKYNKNTISKIVHFHIVGMTRFLYKPIEDIEYQQKLNQTFQKKKRGAPIKIS